MTASLDNVVIDGCAIVTVDPAGTEYDDGHIVVTGNRITSVGTGPAPDSLKERARVVDGHGCLATPGLVNTHHHLYQWVTRGYAVDHTLFEWLTTLYPIWNCIDADIVRVAATGGLGWLAKSGCTLTTDHHYVFPHEGGDVLGAEIEAAKAVGLRFHPTRGSMDLGQSKGGLPPDSVVEEIDTIMSATEAAIDEHHDESTDSMLRIGVAPCSPFSVTADLLKQSAELARARGVRMHTHLCETLDEEDYCREHFDSTPVEYMETVGWLGPDVWFAHAVHLDDASIATLAATGTGAAHCPTSNARLGSGIARLRDLRDAAVPVGLGVDGSASNEACQLLEEVHHAVLFARARGGPREMSVREALEVGTMGGAKVLGRENDLGSLEAGKLADIALWRLDELGHIDVADPVAALVLGAQPPLELLLVNGRPVVENDRLMNVDQDQLAHDVRTANQTLMTKAGVAA
jgi:cytosine/adenosine deaminase-related metal-dependent hydrolase